MSANDLITIARQRRVTALDALKTREANLYSIADYAARNQPAPPMFTSRRTGSAENLFVVDGEDRLAA